MSIAENKKAVFRCIELFNKCTTEWVDSCYSKDLHWTEQPTPSFPKGKAGGFDVFRETAKQLLKLFPNRTLSVIRSIAENEDVVFEQEWKAVAAVSAGNIKAGDNVIMKIVSFFKLKNGLIIEQNDYVISIINN